jgi:thymidylate synthase (FAD)
MCVEIETTRAISPQILRHRSFSFQEFSQRYSQVQELTVPKLRSQDFKNRQNSRDDLPLETQQLWEEMIDNHNQQALALYEGLLEAGVAKECARDVLPTNAKTRLYMSGTIRSWLHYIDLRGANGTQAEHRQIALQVGEILDTELPTVARAMWG